ncbi:hypothetical protein GcM3_047024 [Golovinomyces cichoracearum]|uniref:Uncharacterized protein n=1 Tax=Golovinomyces cichoracearum TaxID=62708 RepID=A0A420J0I5_9PEZI|nr:hypothetical protein GcM3_047024 [Golovinomyces cichoracearum]
MTEPTHQDLEWGSILASFYNTFPAVALVLRSYGLSADPSTLIHDINQNTHSPSFICLAAMLKAFDDGFNRQAQQNAELSETNENLNIRIRPKNVVINELIDVLKADLRQYQRHQPQFTPAEYQAVLLNSMARKQM